MKTKFHKKLSLKKVVISIHGIYGGTGDTDKSSAYLEPTETPTPIDQDPRLISGDNSICI